MTPATPWGTVRGTNLTELGVHVTRDGDRWRCVERPGLVMLRGGRYEVDGPGFNSLARMVKQAMRRSLHDATDTEQVRNWAQAVRRI